MSSAELPTYLAGIPKAQLLGFFAESLLFGIFAVLASISLWILVYRQRRQGPSSGVNISMAVITVAMLLLAGAHLVLDIQRIIQGFTDDIPGGPAAFFARANSPTYVTKPILFAALTVIGDGFMTYRVYVLWDRKPATVVFSGLLIVGTLVTSIGGAYVFVTDSPDGAGLLAPSAIAWSTAFLSLSLATNLVTTLLLLARILWFARHSYMHSGGPAAASIHWKVMRTILRSEGIYSATLIVNLIVYLRTSSALYAIMDILPSVAGISFTLIILHIGLNEAVMGHSASTNVVETSSGLRLPRQREQILSPMEFTDALASAAIWDDACDSTKESDEKSPVALEPVCGSLY